MKGQDLFTRIITKLDIADVCWNWTGCKNPAGYGVITADGKLKLAHRVTYELHKGEIPENLIVRHICDNSSCCNPNHLELGTLKQNQEDVDSRGRRPKGMNHWKTKLSDEQIDAIRKDRRRQVDIASEYGVAQAHVSFIKSGKTRKLTQ